MGTKYFSGIIVYTIQNDKLRDEFRNIILTDLNCEELDQSSYGIPYEEGGVYKDYKNDIKSVCDKAKNKTNTVFSPGDFICFYPTEKSEGKPNMNKILRMEIIKVEES